MLPPSCIFAHYNEYSLIRFCHSSGECCYWYRRFPATPLACHGPPQSTIVTLFCDVEHQPQNSIDNIEVRWYRSRVEETAGINGEILIDDAKYDRGAPVNLQAATLKYGLGILRFNSSDRGYYWCQLVVNNITLSPSPYAYIYSLQCNSLETMCIIDPPLCAQNNIMVMQYNIMALQNGSRTSCSLKNFSNTLTNTATMSQTVNIPTTETVAIPVPDFGTASTARTATKSQMITLSSVTTPMSSTTEIMTIKTSNFPTTQVVSTIIVVIILFVLTIIVASSIVYIKNHKRQSKLTTIDKIICII